MLFPYKDDNPRILVPYVTYAIISINVLVFVFQLNMGMVSSAAEREFIYRFGFIPANFSIITVFTSMFLHGGISHIMGNMWFLWVFGDNVEGVLGHVNLQFFILFADWLRQCHSSLLTLVQRFQWLELLEQSLEF